MTSISTYFSRLVPATLLAAATLAGSGVEEPAVACAAPAEWDIGAYDQCLAGLIGKGLDQKEMLNQTALAL